MKKTFRIALIAGLLLIGFSLWKMYELPLWGHWTLVYFLGLWTVLNAAIFLWKQYDAHDLKNISLTWLGALALSAGFPPYPLIGASFIGLVFFFIHRDRSEHSSYNRFRYNWQLFSGLWLWNILTTFWVENTLFTSGLIANVLNALLMMIPFVLWNRIDKVIPSRWFRYFAFISFWISYEYLHLNWEISWPWLILGHQFAHVPHFIQWYEYTGVLGGTLWVLLINFGLYELWRQKSDLSAHRFIFPAFLLLVPIIYSLFTFLTYKPKGAPSEVVVVQPNFNPHYEKASVSQAEQFDQSLRLTKEVITDSTRWVLLPESAFRGVQTTNILANEGMKAFYDLMKSYPQAAVMIGASAQERWLLQKPEDTQALRTHTYDDGRTIWWKAYNAAVFFRKGGAPMYYKKSKFVPGAEFTPYPKIFFFIKPLSDALGGSLEGLGTQEERTSFQNIELSMATMICYESVYGEYSTKYVTEGGAMALGIMTIDGWWDQTAGHLQHMYLGAIRAIELRKDIARSAITGISGFIDQRGVVWKRSNYEEAVAMREEILFNRERTFYMQWGDMIGRLSVFFMGLSLVYALRNALESRNARNT